MKTKSRLLPLVLLALSPNLFAQAIPGAGSQLRQISPPAPPPKIEPAIRIEEAGKPAGPSVATASVLVRQLHVTGAHIFPEAELVAVAGFVPGTQLTLAELQAMAARITAHYRSHGYFVARATLPAQQIDDNVVTISVSEGNYGKVALRNSSRLSDDVANGVLQGLDTGAPITLDPLEHRLLLLSDVPGVTVTSTLVPGSLPGSSDLLVDVVPGRRVDGLVYVDNAGDPYTGEWRLGGSVNFNNVFGHGDVFSLQAMTAGDGLGYGRVSYQMLLGRVTAGLAYSHMDYDLGRQFDDLGAHGTADVASIFGSLPLIRSRRSNLYLGAIYEDRDLVDELTLFPDDGRRAKAHVAGLSLYGNHQDDLGGGGTTSFFLGASFGSLDINTPAALLIDNTTARTNGSYDKLWFDVSRQQRVTDVLSFNASLSGQWASKNLDPSEDFILGGMDGIRGYPQGEAFGDEGYLANLEAQLLLTGLSSRVAGEVHLLGFVDAGHVRINKDPWLALADNERTLSSAGIGLSWIDAGNFSARMYYAVPLGSEEALSAPDKSGRFWIQAIKYF